MDLPRDRRFILQENNSIRLKPYLRSRNHARCYAGGQMRAQSTTFSGVSFFYFLSETVANLGKTRPNLQPGGLLLARLTTVTSQMQTHVL